MQDQSQKNKLTHHLKVLLKVKINNNSSLTFPDKNKKLVNRINLTVRDLYLKINHTHHKKMLLLLNRKNYHKWLVMKIIFKTKSNKIHKMKDNYLEISLILVIIKRINNIIVRNK